MGSWEGVKKRQVRGSSRRLEKIGHGGASRPVLLTRYCWGDKSRRMRWVGHVSHLG